MSAGIVLWVKYWDWLWAKGRSSMYTYIIAGWQRFQTLDKNALKLQN